MWCRNMNPITGISHLMVSARSAYRTMGILLCLFVAAQVHAQAKMISWDAALPQAQKSIGTSAQQEWLQSSIPDRIKLAEKTGEKGARNWARSQKWKPLLESSDKIVPQGPDAVYLSEDGIAHVIEAKGGTSPLRFAYGYLQGTSEWAVKSAERLLKSANATDLEKRAAYTVLNKAAEGKLEVDVVRTTHVLGELRTTSNKITSCSKAAEDLAGQALREFAMSGGVPPLERPPGSLLRVLTKAGGVIAVSGGLYQTYTGMQKFHKGQLVDGGIDILGGGTNIFAGGAFLAGASKAGMAGIGAGMMVDGVSNIYEGLLHHDKELIGVGSVKLAAGGSIELGIMTGQPILIIGGTLIYVSAVVYQNRDEICEIAYKSKVAIVRQGGMVVDYLQNAANQEIGKLQELAKSFVACKLTQSFNEHLTKVSSTGGNMLVIATLRQNESFEKSESLYILGNHVYLGTTKAEIRVPTTFRYYINLSGHWLIVSKNGACIIMAPPIQAELPPAIDTSKMVKKGDNG